MTSLFTSLTGLTLESPGFLLLALLVPLAFLVRGLRRRPAVLFAPGGFTDPPPGAGPLLPRTARQRLRHLPLLLEAAGLLLVALALARPVSRDALPPTNEGIDILLCLDTSSSMAEEDLDPGRSRLTVAKDAALSFVGRRSGDRIGLVRFARYPDLVCPPTPDHRALAKLLVATPLVEGDGPEDATGIGTAVARAAQVLGRGTAKSKVVILLTDGFENVSRADTPDEIAPIFAGQLCVTLGVRVYAISAGGAGDDPSTAEDVRQIERLAELTGGAFFRARDAFAVDGVYTEIDRMEKVAFAEPRYRIEERFLPFLLFASALLVAGHLLARTFFVVLP